ncbi:MAG: hypothetical protein ACI89J_004151 [Hyphomicrobiaceae bacterium]|jgi:hypothetical protein
MSCRAHHAPRGERVMLSRPSYVVWIISTVIAAVIILMKYAGIQIPMLSDIVSGKSFEFLLLAFILLWLGTIIRRM